MHHFQPLLFIDILHLYRDVDPAKSGRASRTILKIQHYPLPGTRCISIAVVLDLSLLLSNGYTQKSHSLIQ